MRAIIATFLLAVFAWTPTQGISEEPTNIHPVSKQECLSSPSSECLIALAIKVAKSQDSPGTLLKEVAETLLQQGQRERAKLVLGDAIGLGFDAFNTETGFGANSDLWAVSRLSRLLELLEENGFRDLQLRVVSLLEDFLEREKGSDAQDQALYVLFTAFLELGEFEKAFSATVQTTDPVTKWFRYGDVAVAYAKAGRTEEALDISMRIGNPKFREKAKARVAVIFAHQGKIELAKDVLSNAPSDIDTTNAHKAIASALVASGQIDKAVSYTNAMSGKFQKAFVQDSTSGALAAAGEFETALALARSISVYQQRAQALATVGEILVARGEIELAKGVLSEMQHRAFWKDLRWNPRSDPVDESSEAARNRLTIGIVTYLVTENRVSEALAFVTNSKYLSPHERTRLNLALAEALARRGAETETLAIIEKLTKVSSSLRDNYKSSQLQASIGDLYIQIGHFDEARVILFRLDEMYGGSDIQRGAISLIDVGEIDTALEWMSFLKADGLRRPVFLHLVQNLGRTGRSQEALTLIETSSEPTRVKIRAWISLAAAIGE